MNEEKIRAAAQLIRNAKTAIAFTGAGISVESGIPAFRGSEDSVWQRYNPDLLQLQTYLQRPAEAWPCIKEVFYNYTADGNIRPNTAHRVLAHLEEVGLLKCVVTQNVDDLHQQAGSKTVYPFHGSVDTFECLDCKAIEHYSTVDLEQCPPRCKKCNGVLKPRFVFFGEGIPQDTYFASMDAAYAADLVIVVGTTGEVMPACMVPRNAHQSGAKVIEVNTQPSAFTSTITDIFLQGGAVEVFTALAKELDIIL